MIRQLIIYFIIILTNNISIAQECNCTDSFDWMVITFENNDAGFQYVINKNGNDDYKKFTENIREQAKGVKSITSCKTIMNNWLHYFRNGHIGVNIKEAKDSFITKKNSEIRQQYENEKIINLTESELKNILDKKNTINPIEGIWEMEGNRYRIGIIKDNNLDKKFTAFIIKADSIYWMPKQIKAEFTINDDDTTYSVDFYLRDHSKHKVQVKFVNESSTIFYIIDTVINSYWVKEYPKINLSANEKTFSLYKFSKLPSLLKLNDKTIYLRIPSFEYYQKKYIDSILVKNDTLIKSTQNLIIDIRNGTGGSSHSWDKIIPYLYTNPIREGVNQYKASELNAQEYENYARDFKDTSISKRCFNTAKKMREHIGELITFTDSKYYNYKLDKIYNFPQKVAIICNKYNGSADEQFLLYAKQSKKVKVFGTPTQGMIDVANMKTVNFPDNKFTLSYGMTITARINEYCIEGIGIQPDYFLDNTINEIDWIDYTKLIIEQ